MQILLTELLSGALSCRVSFLFAEGTFYQSDCESFPFLCALKSISGDDSAAEDLLLVFIFFSDVLRLNYPTSLSLD